MNYKLRYEESGEVRPPKAGEWFRGTKGEVVQAIFDFSATSHPILKEICEEDKEE